MPDDSTESVVVESEAQWGSDHIADLLKAHDFEFISFNPGASFRGLEESIVNYNDNTPEVIETSHECLSVSIAHGYAKATNEPAACALHNVVGTLHGTMGVFNAYADRVPLLVLSGTGPIRKSKRRPFYDWIHSALVQGNLVRGFVKWDDQPWHIDGAAESIYRALKIADTRPKGPTYVALDHELQETELDEPLSIPDPDKFIPPSKMAPDPSAIEQAAGMLVGSDFPAIMVDQVGDSPDAVKSLVELAELLGAPVFNSHRTGAPHRYNFPNTHPMDLSWTDALSEADTVLALDVWSLDYLLTDIDSESRESQELIDGDFDLIDIGMHELRTSGLVPDQFSMRETELPILADTKLAIPALVEAIEERVQESSALQDRIETRCEAVEMRHEKREQRWKQQVEDQYDETPISLPRLAHEIWRVIEDEPWVLVNGTLRGHAYRQWDIDEFDKYVGGYSGGGGIGYGIGGAIGGALAYQDSDRIPINLQPDGDLMYYPGGLWTMGHYDIPLFTIVHNNGALYNSTKHRINLANYRGRDDSYESALTGTGIWDPTPDYASMAKAMGVNGYGPVEDPDDLSEVLHTAWENVKDGQPVLVDVVCQSR